MNTNVITILCVVVYAIEALPQYSPSSTADTLERLGLSLKDSFNYNEFILNLEAVIEESQQVALSTIENTVDLAQEFAKGLAIFGAQQNVQEISDLQSSYFKLFEDARHRAYDQNMDISSCVYPAVKRMHNESQTSVNEISDKLTNITTIFSNYTTVTFVEPAKINLAKSYTIRERIYQCPFSFTDFTPFYLCLTVAAVLEDVVTLNQFALHYNDTSTTVYNLVVEYRDAVTFFRNENVDAFNATAQSVYNDVFVPCAADIGFKV